MNRERIEHFLNEAVEQVDKLMEKFSKDFPSASTTKLLYQHKPNKEWTAGFFTGMVWLAYEWTGKEKYKKFAQLHTESFKKRIENKVSIDFHDLGFLYTLSCVADYKITGSEIARETAIKAADHLLDRFQSSGNFIQAWGNMDDLQEYRMIIDCFLNLPLLFWATEVTGEYKYAKIAYMHYHTAVKNVIRTDFTTCHTLFFDRETGKPLREVTNQGYSDDSCWSRGQAWAIYGVSLFLKYIPLEKYTEMQRFNGLLDVFEKNLSTDKIPVWDFKAREDVELKDSSAAAITVCGIQAMDNICGNKMNPRFLKLKEQMLDALMDKCDASHCVKEHDGILLHGTHHWPRKQGIDESVLWGDYFYMEALIREAKTWNSYW